MIFPTLPARRAVTPADLLAHACWRGAVVEGPMLHAFTPWGPNYLTPGKGAQVLAWRVTRGAAVAWIACEQTARAGFVVVATTYDENPQAPRVFAQIDAPSRNKARDLLRDLLKQGDVKRGGGVIREAFEGGASWRFSWQRWAGQPGKLKCLDTW